MLGWIILSVAVVLIAAFFILVYICYRMAFGVPERYRNDLGTLMSGEQYDAVADKSKELIEQILSIPCEDVVITSSKGGLRLCGRYYEAKPGAPVNIMFHGYRSLALRDFSGGAQLAMECGCNALLVDQRAHGKSEGRCLGFGILERRDLLDWVNYVIGRFGPDTKIILTGMSMGAATVLMSTDLELPKNVVGVIADCGYSSARAIIRKVLRDEMHLPVAPAYALVKIGARIYGGFDLEETTAPLSLSKAKVPVLFIHGEDDRFVPCDMTRENYSACASEKTLLTVPNAGHGISYLTDYDAYSRHVHEFIEKTAK